VSSTTERILGYELTSAHLPHPQATHKLSTVIHRVFNRDQWVPGTGD
jgi:hypothetical protein